MGCSELEDRIEYELGKMTDKALRKEREMKRNEALRKLLFPGVLVKLRDNLEEDTPDTGLRFCGIVWAVHEEGVDVLLVEPCIAKGEGDRLKIMEIADYKFREIVEFYFSAEGDEWLILYTEEMYKLVKGMPPQEALGYGWKGNYYKVIDDVPVKQDLSIREMTVDQISKELGYTVKVIGKDR